MRVATEPSFRRADSPTPPRKSFRDPAGAVWRTGDRILRTVRSDGAADLDDFLATRTARAAMERGNLVRSVRLAPTEFPAVPAGDALYEHERIWFPSYPHEWPAELLHAAGQLTQELGRGALTEGFGLKDATPYNVLFQGGTPVFVDVLSFERRDGRDATWMAYSQFVQTFLLPLLAYREFGLLPADLFMRRREGLEPEEMYRMAGLRQQLSPEFLSLVTLPHWMSGVMTRRSTAGRYHPEPLDSEEKARFVLDRLLANCSRKLARLEPQATKSAWTDYLDHKSLYSSAQLEQKDRFVREALDRARPRTVLDVGANEGHFSFMAADQKASVVAIDSDASVTGNIWRQARARNLDVLPLVVDLARPTPALGWRNQECDSFLDRARGSFDLVMMLAVIHHMLVTERVPLEEIVALAAELTRGYLLIEFVAPSDPMFMRIVRGRESLHLNLTRAAFESAAALHFDLVKAEPLDGLDRCLYLYRLRSSKA